jgi:hypothetical protein
MFPAFKAGSEEKKKEVLDKVAKEAAPKTLKYLARLLEQRGGDYFAGNEVNLKLFTGCGNVNLISFSLTNKNLFHF